MFTSKFFTVLLIAVSLLTACAPKATTPALADPITLRLGIPDGDDVLYAPYVLEFIEQAKTLSNGNITIEPTWEAGDSTNAGYEVGLIQLVKDGSIWALQHPAPSIAQALQVLKPYRRLF